MTLSARAVEIIRQLHAKFITLAEGSDNDRRALTLKMAEQMRFELGPGWGTKKSGPGNPQSKDAIAYTTNEANELAPMDVWDWQGGESRAPIVQAGDAPTYPGLTGQRFIRVQPLNHLSTVNPAPTPQPPVPPTPIPQPPQPPTPSPVSYHSWVSGEACAALTAAYVKKYGREPHAEYWRHLGYRLYEENWTLENMLKDI